jgi:hypothetical protein
MPNHPWTPGPWTHEHCVDVEGDRWDWLTCPDGDQPHYGETSHDVRTPEQGAINTALIALAPEMAEAILRWDEGDDYTVAPVEYDKTVDILEGIAERLRAIGRKS